MSQSPVPTMRVLILCERFGIMVWDTGLSGFGFKRHIEKRATNPLILQKKVSWDMWQTVGPARQ